jgi:sporulation protein YlmC with PRC-barrel domain
MTETRKVFLGFDLLDRQILDKNEEPVGNVDDVELAVDEDGTLRVSALYVGAQAWGRRLGGALGRAITDASIRLQRREPPGPIRIPFDLVVSDGPSAAVRLAVSRDLLAEPELEAWLREHVIARIPGSEEAGA